MCNRFLKCIAYGIRMHNADIDARTWPAGGKPPYVILRLGSMPDDVDKPLAYAMNYLQASSAALHVLQRYLQRDQMDGAYYPWTTIDRHDLGMTVKEYVNFNVGPRLLQIETGLPLPDTFKMYAWNQLSVENGFTAECIRKRTAFKAWETEIATSAKPNPLFDGDGHFPPNPSRHPSWVFDSGRAAPQAAPSSTQGPQHPGQEVYDVWRDVPWGSASLQRRHRGQLQAKDQRTDRPEPLGSSSSRHQGRPQPEDEPEPIWIQEPIPDGASEYTFRVFKSATPRTSTLYLTLSIDEAVHL